MDGIINTHLSGITASGKRFTRVRCAFDGDPFALYVCNSFGFPDWGRDVPEGISVKKTNSYDLNVSYRDSLIIRSGTGMWQLKIDDYINGGMLDCYQMHADLNVLISMIANGRQSDWLDAHRYNN